MSTMVNGKPVTPEPKSRMRKPLKIALYTVGALALIGIGTGIGSAGASPKTGNGATPTVTKTVFVTTPGQGTTSTVTVTAQPAAAGPSMPGNGTFVVGTGSGDWLPGTWQTAGATSDDCYWATLTDLTGSETSIISNNNVTGPTVLTVTSADAGIEVSGCDTWQKIG